MKNQWNLHQVSVAFNTQQGVRVVLKDVSLDIRHGEWVGIVGPNGSGKSTLGRVLAGLLKASRGSVYMNEEANVFAPLVFQNPEAQILGETVEEDVYFGLDCKGLAEQEMASRAGHALDLVRLSTLRHALVHELSGGQKQRLATADALALASDAVIFDEATSMLHPQARHELLQVVKKLHHQGLTIIWITQWLEELAETSRVVALNDGEIAFDGTPRQFFYGEACSSEETASPCDSLGFTPPYTVALARQLHRMGRLRNQHPLSSDELAEVLSP